MSPATELPSKSDSIRRTTDPDTIRAMSPGFLARTSVRTHSSLLRILPRLRSYCPKLGPKNGNCYRRRGGWVRLAKTLQSALGSFGRTAQLRLGSFGKNAFCRCKSLPTEDFRQTVVHRRADCRRRLGSFGKNAAIGVGFVWPKKRNRGWVRFAKMHLPLREPCYRGLQADGGASTSQPLLAVGFGPVGFGLGPVRRTLVLVLVAEVVADMAVRPRLCRSW